VATEQEEEGVAGQHPTLTRQRNAAPAAGEHEEQEEAGEAQFSTLPLHELKGKRNYQHMIMYPRGLLLWVIYSRSRKGRRRRRRRRRIWWSWWWISFW
jgi:hypothetical protein